MRAFLLRDKAASRLSAFKNFFQEGDLDKFSDYRGRVRITDCLLIFVKEKAQRAVVVQVVRPALGQTLLHFD